MYLAAKHQPADAGIHQVMDAFILEAAGTAGAVALGIMLRRRKRPTRRAVVRPPAARSIRDLRRRHRRAARAVIALAHECLERHPDGSFEAFTAREAVQSYLPETLSAYLTVPRELRRARRAGRPSADDELGRQLETLHRGLERIREADAETGAARMTANGAFLSERFGAPEIALPAARRSIFGELVDVLETALRGI